MPDPVTVLVVDDHPVVRAGLVSVLSVVPELSVVASADSVASALDAQRRHAPRVTVLDFQMKDGTAVDVLTRAAADGLTLRGLVLSTYDGPWDIHQSLRAGARGYLLKESPQPVVVQAIRTVAAGRRYIPAEIAARAAEALGVETLTQREQDVLHRLAEGRSNRSIAAELGISEGTTKVHVNSILEKLGAESRTEAVVRAARWGLVPLRRLADESA